MGGAGAFSSSYWDINLIIISGEERNGCVAHVLEESLCVLFGIGLEGIELTQGLRMREMVPEHEEVIPNLSDPAYQSRLYKHSLLIESRDYHIAV